MFKKGNIAWNKGKSSYIRTKEHKDLMSELLRGRKHKPFSKEYKEKRSELMNGSGNYNWKGGKYKDKEGYVYIKNRKHPFCNAKGYVFEHRLVVEKIIGRYLNSEEIVHHKNFVKDDNRPRNLMAFVNNAVHKRLEKGKVISSKDIIFNGNTYIDKESAIKAVEKRKRSGGVSL